MSKNDINFKALKKKFPIFAEQVNNQYLVYLDSVSTAQMPQQVVDALIQYYTSYKANVGRGIYAFAEQATEQFEKARSKVSNFIGAQKQEIIITSGTTHGINLVVRAWAEGNIKQGDEIVVSEIEHHSNFVPWQQLALRVGAQIKVVPVNEHGVVEIATLQSYLSDKTKLVAIIHTSNVLGTTNDVAAITQAAHSIGAKVLIDAAQSVAHQQIDVKQIDCDFLVFSGHKLFGPTGVGILYVKELLFDQCQLINFGGGMVYSVSSDETIFRKAPHCFESGTQPIAQMIGLGAAVDFIQAYVEYDQLQVHETRLVQQLVKELQQFKDITIVSHVPEDVEHSNLVTFVSERFHAHDIAAFLDQYGVAVRAGHHCVQPYHVKLGVNASVRVSFSMYNTEQDIKQLIQCLKELLHATD